MLSFSFFLSFSFVINTSIVVFQPKGLHIVYHPQGMDYQQFVARDPNKLTTKEKEEEEEESE